MKHAMICHIRRNEFGPAVGLCGKRARLHGGEAVVTCLRCTWLYFTFWAFMPFGLWEPKRRAA